MTELATSSPFASFAGTTAAVHHLAGLAAGPAGSLRDRVLASMAAVQRYEQDLFDVMITSIDEMVDLTNIGTLFAFVLVCAGITVMRYREPDRVRPFRVPFGPVLVPSLGVLSCAALICFLPRTSWLRFAGWLAAGLVIYGLYGLRHSRLRPLR